MAVVAVLPELLIFVNGVWIAASLPLLLLLAVATAIGSRRSRAEARRAGVAAPLETALGRRTRTTAYTAASLILASPFVLLSISALPHGAIATAWVGALVALVLTIDVLSASLVVLLLRVIVDVYARGRTAGPETVYAYVSILMVYAAMVLLVGGLGWLGWVL